MNVTELIVLNGTTLKEELNSTCKLEDLYKLKCGEIVKFNYLTERKVWYSIHCYNWKI
jgi:hypothetical protein